MTCGITDHGYVHACKWLHCEARHTKFSLLLLISFKKSVKRQSLLD